MPENLENTGKTGDLPWHSVWKQV